MHLRTYGHDLTTLVRWEVIISMKAYEHDDAGCALLAQIARDTGLVVGASEVGG